MKTPYFILSRKRLAENYKELDSLCKKHFKSFKIAYSIKTNSLKEVIKIFGNFDSGFEVASLREMLLLPERKFVVYNSPAKTIEELKFAIKNKFLINIDSKSELDKIASIAKGKSIEAGLRIALEDSKFGVEISKARELIEYAKSKNIKIVCLHFHQGTQKSLNSYVRNIKAFSKIVAELSSSIELKYVNIGGGIPDKQQMKNLNVKLEDYIRVASKNLSKFNTTIILEPGRFLVADAMQLVTRVIAIKENFSKRYAILDVGINILPKITLAQYRFILPKGSQDYILAGPLLFSNDILAKVKSELKEDDIIKVENVGAYCYNLAWEISYKKPKIYIE